VAGWLSVFRSVFTFATAKAVLADIKEKRLWELMMELRDLGFLFYHEAGDLFDFHPIVRAFLYRDLVYSEGTGIHTRAAAYFEALPEPQKVVTLADLGPVIERYHHMVKAGKWDKACVLFRDRIEEPTYHQLAAYHLRIELLLQLFPEAKKDAGLPRLEMKSAQAWTLNALAASYSLSGQPAKAVPFYLLQINLYEKNEEKIYLAIGLGNVAQAQWNIGHLSAATVQLRKCIRLCRRVEMAYFEASGHQELVRVLAFRGPKHSAAAEAQWAQATTYWKKTNDYQGLSMVYSYRSLSAGLQARLATVVSDRERGVAELGSEALEAARRALEFAEKNAKSSYPLPRDFVRAYWLLGAALIKCREPATGIDPGSFEIPFYDPHFQALTGVVPVIAGRQLDAAEACLNEALHRCRETNMVEMEPNILLELARLHRSRGLSPTIPILEEIQTIAQRAGYRFALADLHLLCGQWLIEDKKKTILLGLNASQHLEKTREYARDVSQLEDLYASPNPEFYRDIPEYQMLKRGMTDQERIDNGYWIAYKIATELLKKE
jgi:tetratricopeptide (TPR) repeat protein